MIDMTIKLDPNTNPITNMFITGLHVCKQQQTPTAKCLFHVSLNISNTLVGMYMKLHKTYTLMAKCAPMCSNVCKQCSLHVNNNNGTLVVHYKREIILHLTGHQCQI